MIEIGIYQELTVVSLKEQGVYLGEKEDADRMERVLLPKKQVPEGTEAGDKLRVFVYRDSSDRLIATTAAPALTLHQVARLRVAQTTGIGAFLDWGLEKDLFLPFQEQTRRVKPGEQVLAALYLDKSGRLAATMKMRIRGRGRPLRRTDPEAGGAGALLDRPESYAPRDEGQTGWKAGSFAA